MLKNVRVYLSILALLQPPSWSYSGLVEALVPTNNRGAFIRRYDAEVNSFCKVDGSTAVHANWPCLWIGAHSNFALGCGEYFTRSLLAFNEVDLLPSDAIIKSAQIKLFGRVAGAFQAYSLSDEYGVTNEVLIKRILTEWDPATVTWMTQPETTDINTAIIPSTRPTFPDIALNTELYNFTIDVTLLVRDIHASGPGNNYGFMLQMKYEKRYRFMDFCSFDHPDTDRHPQIIIEI